MAEYEELERGYRIISALIPYREDIFPATRGGRASSVRAIARAGEGAGLRPETPPRGSAPWIPAKGDGPWNPLMGLFSGEGLR